MRATFDGSSSVLVITGGANGIGKALGQTTVAAGTTVVLCDVDRAALDLATADQPGLHRRILNVADGDAVFARRLRRHPQRHAQQGHDTTTHITQVQE